MIVFIKKHLFKSIMLTITLIAALFILAPLTLLLVKGALASGQLIQDKSLLKALLLSVKTSFISTAICLNMGICGAYILSGRKTRLSSVMSILISLPMSFPHLISGIALLLLFSTTSFGKWFTENGFSIIFTVKGIIIAQVFVNLPYVMTTLKTAFDRIPKKMIFMASSLGCQPGRIFFRILLPDLGEEILTTSIVAWSKALGEFGAVLMVAGSIENKTETLPVAIYMNMSTGNLSGALAVSFVLMVVSTLVIVLFEGVKKHANTRNS